MNSMVKENIMVSPYFLFFLMHAPQTGIGLLNFQSKIAKGAGQDAWLSVIAFGLMTHIVFVMILHILRNSSGGDILSFHKDVFGRLVGGTLNIIMACYFSLVSLFALNTYIDILQIWVFDGIASWEYSLLFSILIYYIVAGGFRIITGITFWSVVIPSSILLSLIYSVRFSETSYILPLFNHNWMDYVISAKEAAPIFLGFETALVFFPFIKNRDKARKWGHIALLYTTCLCTVITIITFLFFNQEKLEYLSWPTLTMIKIIKFPFLERFEFIFIFTWLLVVMPVICIYLWSAIRAIKFTIPKARPTFILIGFLAIFHYVNSEFLDIQFWDIMDKIISFCGLAFLFCYIPLLFLISVIRKKVNG